MSDGGNLSSRRPMIGRTLVAIASLAIFASLAIPTTLQAQVTAGNIAGTVSDPSSGVLPGVTVEAVHTPTGTHYSTVSVAGGRFTIPNARVGGPYKITASLEGFKQTEVNNIVVNLGQTTEVDLHS